MRVLLKRMAHSLFIFLSLFSYFLINFILFWSFCKILIIVLLLLLLCYYWIIFRLKTVNGNLNRSKIGIYPIIKKGLMLKRAKDKNSGQSDVRTKKELELLPVVVAEVRC